MKIENGIELGIEAERALGGESDPISLGRLRCEVDLCGLKDRVGYTEIRWTPTQNELRRAGLWRTILLVRF